MYFLEAGKFHYISFSITDHLSSLPWELRNTQGRRREKQEIFGKTISSSAGVWYYLDIQDVNFGRDSTTSSLPRSRF